MEQRDLIDFANEDVPLLEHEQQPRQNIDLPNGKRFHLFVSHSADDSEEVWNLITNLERRFGIRCLYADRDFQPGKDITDNIRDGIEGSLKTLLVLTPSYLDSGYCWFEQKVAFQMSITKRQNCLIPVILKPTEGPLPSTLSNLTYIDVSKELDVPARIYEALVKTDLSHASPFDDDKENETFESVQKAKQQNGATLLEVFAKPFYSVLSGSGWEFKALTPEQVNQLSSLGIDVDGEYERIRKDINKQCYLRYLGLRSSYFRRCCSGCLIIIIVVLVIYIILCLTFFAKKYNVGTHVDSVLWLAIFGPVAIVLVTIFCCVLPCWYRNKKFKAGVTLCWRHSLHFYRQKKCFILYDIKSFQPKILFIRYDTRKCKEYLMHFYRRRNPGLLDGDYVDCAQNAIDAYLGRNNQKLVDWKSLPTSFMNRHDTFRQKACLCQLVLDEIII